MVRNDIKPDLQNIEDYFSKRREFYIPSYQRPYAWQVGQCEQLIEDIKNHQENFSADEQDNYFFGAVLIAQESGEEHEISLIDGQQRTTTFMLLLKAVLLKLKQEISHLSEESLADARLLEELKGLIARTVTMLYNLSDEDAFNYRRGQHDLQDHQIKYKNDSISELYASDLNSILRGEDLSTIEYSVIKIKGRRKDNKYTNFYKNFRYFYHYCQSLTNTQIRDFATHLLSHCQIITITSFNTDQAINIFNSLNGTGLPLTAIEVLVSRATAVSKDRRDFEASWKDLVQRVDQSSLDLNLLMTYYIFVKLAKEQKETNNRGIRAFFKKRAYLLKEDQIFINELNQIISNWSSFEQTELGQIMGRFYGNFRPFVSSYLFYRSTDSRYLSYLLRLAILLDVTDFSYSHSIFKGFLEKINLKYSQVDTYSESDLIQEVKDHIAHHFTPEDIRSRLLESGLPKTLVFVNDYLYSQEQGLPFKLDGLVDVEHIMPQSGLNRESIMRDAGFVDQDEFYSYAEKLGNKILLEAEINRGIGDAWFRTKKENEVTSGQGYRGSRYHLAQALSEYAKDTWDKEDIEKATEKIADRFINFLFN
ncbi:DUF262 domain-containing protein [Streptococcus sp. sy018]|uniref:DUF262 domain-containing protein n=1 Tax=Streptococcus sp. sy018 TaxID=2600147 RepID=UPI0011B665CE|nr:DUF262 domain-containing protein [Streptococcus sp. sy018]TWS95376.1 DUF262 domain-containing protein [Streptococcus sp. sy018]